MDSEAQARAVEEDIERTRNEMDATLSELERRLAPSEIVHQGAETMRERVRGIATNAVETVKRHPVPVALAIGVALARYAYRPSAEQRLQMQADEDFDRAWRIVRAGLSRAKEESFAREADLERRARELMSEARAYVGPALHTAEQFARRGGEDAWRLLQHAAERSRNASLALREGSSAHPIATIALLGLAALLARRMRSAY
jgi:hypothetical protein